MHFVIIFALVGFGISLVTQPMLQLRPNCSSLRSMDYYHQIFCRFRKCKRKVPPPSPLSTDFEKRSFFSNKFFFPTIFFFRHISKSCSVFYILKTKNFFGTLKNFFLNFFFLNLHVPGYTKIKKKFNFFWSFRKKIFVFNM